jgi:zinc protease
MKKSKIIINILLAVLFISVNGFAQLKLPPITEETLDNGLQLVIVENHELPLVTMRLVVKAGAANDPNEKAGLANLTAGLLRQGTATLKATEIADKIDFVGGSLSASTNRDYTNISCSVLLKHFDVGFGLLADIVVNPKFDSSEFARELNQTIAGVIQSKDDPDNLCERGFNQALFGTNPYGRPSVGTEASLKNITVEDVKKFYRDYYLPNNAILLVAGDVMPAAIIKETRKAFSGWEKGSVPVMNSMPANEPSGRSVMLIDKPDATQSNIRFGHLGITRKDPDYYPLLLMNYILGGSFTSRLNAVVRVQKGLTYDIRTQNEWNVMPGAYYCNTYTPNESTMIAIQASLDVIKKMQTELVTDEEFNEAKNFYSGYYPGSLETADNIVSEIIKIKLYGLPVSYIEDFTENINKVTKEAILKAAKNHWNTDNLIFCVVGKASEIEKMLAPLGPITKKTIDQF